MFKLLLYLKYNLPHQQTAEGPVPLYGHQRATGTGSCTGDHPHIQQCVRTDGNPIPKGHSKAKTAPRQLLQACSSTITLMAVWDCCKLRHQTFKRPWVQRNVLQLMPFPTLTMRLVGELKLENRMSELLFPTGFVLIKGNTEFMQRSSTTVLKRRQRWNHQQADAVQPPLIFYLQSKSQSQSRYFVKYVNLNLLLKMTTKLETLSPKQSCPFCLTSGSMPATRS